jgi:integrase
MRIRNDITVIFHKPRQRWLVRWWSKYSPTEAKQQRYCKSFVKKFQADQFAQTLDIDQKDGICIEPKTITLKNLTDRFLASKNDKRPATVNAYQETISRLLTTFGSYRNIKNITFHDAQNFINSLELLELDKEPSDSTRLKHLTNAKILFNQALKWDYLRKNPFHDISITDISKEDWYPIKPAEFQALLKAIDQIPIRKSREKEDRERIIRTKAFYCVMYGCGLRFGEAINLWWDKNIDWTHNKIHIKNRKAKDGFPPFSIKNHQDRSIPAPQWVMDSLKELKKISHRNNPYVFLTEDRLLLIKAKWSQWKNEDKVNRWKNSVMVNNTNRDFVVLCRRAGIISSDRLSVHCLRKGYGTNLADLNTPVHTLKSLMGHSNIQTTMKFYIFNSDANSMQAVRKLEEMMGGGG